MGEAAQLHYIGREIDWHLVHFPILIDFLVCSLGPGSSCEAVKMSITSLLLLLFFPSWRQASIKSLAQAFWLNQIYSHREGQDFNHIHLALSGKCFGLGFSITLHIFCYTHQFSAGVKGRSLVKFQTKRNFLTLCVGTVHLKDRRYWWYCYMGGGTWREESWDQTKHG